MGIERETWDNKPKRSADRIVECGCGPLSENNKQKQETTMKWKLLVIVCLAALAFAGCDSGSKPAGDKPAEVSPPATNAAPPAP